MPGTGRDSPTRLARLGRLTNDPQSAGARIFVGNITPTTATDLDLRDIFYEFGEITGISMHNNGKYAFVQFETEEQARRAINGALGRVVGGRRIDVRPAVDKKSGRPGASSGASGAGSGSYSRPPQTSYHSHEAPSSGPPQSLDPSGRKLTRSDFRLFDVGQTGAKRAAATADAVLGNAALPAASAGAAPAADSQGPPPDYSGAPGSRYAPPPAGGSAPEQSAPPAANPPPEGPPPARPHPEMPPRSPPRGHFERGRSPHWPVNDRPASPERYRGFERAHSPGLQRYEEERRRYEYELARWEDEERYRRWYYERYGDHGHPHDERYDRGYHREPHHHHERGGRGGRYEDYWRRQDHDRRPEYHHPHHHPHEYERERRGPFPPERHYERGPERYPPPPGPEDHVRRSPPREFYEKKERPAPPATAPAPPPQPQRPPLDSLVLMVHKQQQGYANLISHRLKEAGMLSETREMPASASLADIIAAGIKRKLLFLFVVTSDNELHRSLSVHILHTTPVQEHKNMPFDDAQQLVKKNFDEYCADVRAGRVPSRLAPGQTTTAKSSGEGGTQSNPADISSEQLSTLISSLREKQQAAGQDGAQDGSNGASAAPTDGDADQKGPKFNWTG